MNTIGFKNFRRFANFPEIDLGDVTVLVGGNNSGKSTLVKALLLCVDNLRLMRMDDRRHGESKSFLSFNKPLFRFDANEYHDVKIKEFVRAIHNKPVEYDDLFSIVPDRKINHCPQLLFLISHLDNSISHSMFLETETSVLQLETWTAL